jgi:hypothetical protein
LSCEILQKTCQGLVKGARFWIDQISSLHSGPFATAIRSRKPRRVRPSVAANARLAVGHMRAESAVSARSRLDVCVIDATPNI